MEKHRTSCFQSFGLCLLLAGGFVVSVLGQNASPPPSAPAQRSQADLEKLVAPIALYPDPLLATVLPASVYPLEIVEAARFVKDTNNISKLDQQPWDDNVKAVARFPDVIEKMNTDLSWTSELGQAFLDQQADVMASIQSMRAKAQSAGTLKTTSQQVVIVTNTVVQIQPAQPEVIYVPAYDPAVVYAPSPGASLITFGVGMAVGAAIANDCDWDNGGIYIGPHGAAVWGGGHGDVEVDIDVNRTVNVNNNNVSANKTAQGQKWQPDQNRLKTSGAPASAKSMESRGWSSPAASTASSGPGSARPAAGTTSANRPAASPAASPAANRPAASPSASPSRSPAGASAGSQESAFGGTSNGSRDNSASQRGSASRGGGAARGGGGGRR